MFWAVTVPLDVTVAVPVPSLIVMVFVFATGKDEAPVKPETFPGTLANRGLTEKFAGLRSSELAMEGFVELVWGNVGRLRPYVMVDVAAAGRKLFLNCKGAGVSPSGFPV